MMTITRIGMDLAKQVFQLHGVDERGHTLPQFFAQLRPCLVGVEACGSAH